MPSAFYFRADEPMSPSAPRGYRTCDKLSLPALNAPPMLYIKFCFFWSFLLTMPKAVFDMLRFLLEFIGCETGSWRAGLWPMPAAGPADVVEP